MSDVQKIIDRMLTATGAQNTVKLAEIIHSDQSSISRWKQRKKVSTEAIVDICLRFNVNVQWLTEGKGPMIWGQPTGAGLVGEPKPSTCTLKERLETAWVAADDDAKDTALYALEKSARRSPGRGGGVSDLTVKKSA